MNEANMLVVCVCVCVDVCNICMYSYLDDDQNLAVTSRKKTVDEVVVDLKILIWKNIFDPNEIK